MKFYIMIVLLALFGISYLYERSLRFKLISEFNEKIDQASAEILQSRKKLASNQLQSCPECPECEADKPVQEEEEEAIQEVIESPDQLIQSWTTRDEAMVGEIKRLSS